MIEVAPRLWVGSQADYERKRPAWPIVQACKEPYHRKALGYTTRGAPKDSPEYLFCYRGKRLILNIVDVDDPQFISAAGVDEAVGFVRRQRGVDVLIHCNQGRSRSPSIAMLALAGDLPETFDDAETIMRRLYPPYDPARGVHEFARANWQRYRALEISPQTPRATIAA